MQNPLEFINPEARILYDQIEALDFSDKTIDIEKQVSDAINNYIMSNIKKTNLNHDLGHKLLIDIESFNFVLYLTYRNVPIHLESILHCSTEPNKFKISILKSINRFAETINYCNNPKIGKYNEFIGHIRSESYKINQLHEITDHFMTLNDFIKANHKEKTNKNFGNEHDFNQYIKLNNIKIGESDDIYDLYLCIDHFDSLSNNHMHYHTNCSDELGRFIQKTINKEIKSDSIKTAVIVLDSIDIYFIFHNTNTDKIHYFKIVDFIIEDIPFFTKLVINNYIIKDFKETK